ncbi:hypothetical protein GGTG_03393 [Gaeumannomyces tritici R3-111a-1]|uniref:Cyanovirin-N domain-containing protein n=1 Tax=Gaeumannomyces tritici (strain R3-111a-1) TaxID=644352 RepID=J3NQ36_GAET3|nr:hypothetical protein GGTG_03393 [Gaeumannomyces tritici R3-111a-1]EJT78292.1 hypothetical protein GGTG_03393 [Gaeumannomyces tritici R3-111a-1]
MNLLLLFSALFFFATEAVSGISTRTALARRSFFTTCKDVRTSGVFLFATCDKKPGSDPKSIHSYLDLRNCLTQFNGTLAPATHLKGQGLDQVTACAMTSGSTKLTCSVIPQCAGCQNQTNPLDLEGIIHNNDGQLECKQE